MLILKIWRCIPLEKKSNRTSTIWMMAKRKTSRSNPISVSWAADGWRFSGNLFLLSFHDVWAFHRDNRTGNPQCTQAPAPGGIPYPGTGSSDSLGGRWILLFKVLHFSSGWREVDGWKWQKCLIYKGWKVFDVYQENLVKYHKISQNRDSK